jgi:sRNA-binding carbon storage regulator CsrA
VAGDVRIVVLKTRCGRVSIGIEAPQDVRVLRGELVDWREGEEE